jgi:hypothetical protein
MGSLFKDSIFLVLAIAIGVYLYMLIREDVDAGPPIQETINAAAALATPDAQTPSEIERDAPTSTATEAASPSADEICKRDEERFAHLLASRSSEEAARFANELGCEKLRPRLLALIGDLGRSAQAAPVVDVANDATSETKTTEEVDRPTFPSSAIEAASPLPDEICKQDEDRLAHLLASPSSEEAARFANELGCEKLRAQLLALIGDLGRSATAAAAAGVADAVPSDAKATNEADRPTPSPGETQVAAIIPDEVCKHDQERLDRLRSNPSSEEAARFANELGCEKLRPQLLALIGDLGRSATAAAAVGVVDAVPSDANATNEADRPTPSSGEAQVAVIIPDEVCKHDQVRLDRLRSNPSSEEAARFAKELGCEKLRPQLLALIGDLGRSASAAAVGGVANGVALDAKATNAAERPAAPSVETQVAAVTPDEVCKHDQVRLDRLRSNPSSEEAARFAKELGCEKLRPQISRLAESLGYVGPTLTSASEGPSDRGNQANEQKADSDCVSERDTLDRVRAQPSPDAAQHLWRDLRCERLRPQVRLLLESLNVAADPSGACRREAEELDRIRTNPNRSEAEDFVRAMTCNALKPQAARLLESLAE